MFCRNEIMRSFVSDGNFKANHLRQKRPEDDVWLTSGEGMMAERTAYASHLAIAQETTEVHATCYFRPVNCMLTIL